MYLSNHHLLSSRNLDELREILTNQFSPHELNITRRGHDVDACINGCRLNNLGLTSVSYGDDVPIRVNVKDDQCEDIIMLNVFSNGAGCLEQKGKTWDVSGRMGVVFSLQQPLTFNSCNVHGIAVSFSIDSLREHARSLFGDHVIQTNFHFDCKIDMATAEGKALRNAVIHVTKEMNGPLAELNNPIALSNLETYLLSQFLSLQPNSFIMLPEQRIAHTVLPYHIKRARDYIHAHAHTKITIQDLAAYAGCSYRTLQTAFNKAFALSPMTYIDTVRLEGVRKDLLTADPQTVTVAAIATHWGFVHMGRMSAAYKKQYGVTPSDTLKRKR